MGEVYLFIATPNNSGSTLWQRSLMVAPGVNMLPLEGKDYFRNHGKRRWIQRPLGPHPIRLDKHGLGRRFALSEDDLVRPCAYSWPGIRKEWHKVWDLRSRGPKEILAVKEPMFSIITHLLSGEFPEAKIIANLRHPFAVCEGICRHVPAATIEQAARHWLICSKRLINQKQILGDQMILTSYELMCSGPGLVSEEVRAWLGLRHFDIRDGAHKANIAGENRLIDMNKQQVARLGPADMDRIVAVLEEDAHIVRKAGYGQTLDTGGSSYRRSDPGPDCVAGDLGEHPERAVGSADILGGR